MQSEQGELQVSSRTVKVSLLPLKLLWADSVNGKLSVVLRWKFWASMWHKESISGAEQEFKRINTAVLLPMCSVPN